MGNTVTVATALRCTHALGVSRTRYSSSEPLTGRLSLQTARAHKGVNEMLYFPSSICQALFVGTINAARDKHGRSSPIYAEKIVTRGFRWDGCGPLFRPSAALLTPAHVAELLIPSWPLLAHHNKANPDF